MYNILLIHDDIRSVVEFNLRKTLRYKPSIFKNMDSCIKEKLRLLREAQGLSQKSIAKRLNLTQQAYSAIENNPENAKLDRLRELCKILGISMRTLFLCNFKCTDGANQNEIVVTDKLPVIVFLSDTEKLAFEKQISNLQNELQQLKSKT